MHPFADYESSDGVLRYRNRKPRRRDRFARALKRLEQLKKRATAWQGQFTHNANF